MSDDDAGEGPVKPGRIYTSGYGKPPEGFRWKKGQSGNPAGRRKAPKTRSEWDALLLEKFATLKNGKRGKTTTLDVHLQKKLKAASEGDFKATMYLLDMLAVYGVEEATPTATSLGGVVRRQRFTTMPPRMEEIFLAVAGPEPWPADAFRRARGVYLQEISTMSDEERLELVQAYADLEPGSEAAAAAYYKEKYLLGNTAKAFKPTAAVDPVRKALIDFANATYAVSEGGKKRRMTVYALLQKLFQGHFMEGRATMLQVRKLSGRTASGAQPKLPPQGVMVAPPEQPLEELKWATEMHNAHHEKRPTLESILAPARLIFAERSSKLTGKPLPPEHAQLRAAVEAFNKPDPAAQARIDELKKNRPDPYHAHASLRPPGWKPPKPLTHGPSLASPTPPPGRPAKPPPWPPEVAAPPPPVGTLKERESQLAQRRRDVDAKWLVDGQEVTKAGYVDSQKVAVLRAWYAEEQRQMEEVEEGLAKERFEIFKKESERRSLMEQQEPPPPPPNRPRTYR